MEIWLTIFPCYYCKSWGNLGKILGVREFEILTDADVFLSKILPGLVQKCPPRNHPDVVRPVGLGSLIHNRQWYRRIVVAEGSQSREIVAANLGCRFDLISADQFAVPLEYEIHLRTGIGLPKKDSRFRAGIVEITMEFKDDELLEESPCQARVGRRARRLFTALVTPVSKKRTSDGPPAVYVRFSARAEDGNQ